MSEREVAPGVARVAAPRGIDGSTPPADAEARARIVTELDASMLVEAGAGSGKTTELVNRMLALVRGKVRVEQIAAVTFTRKAAGQLSQRFRTELERALAQALRSEPQAAPPLEAAVQAVDRAFVGTIHAFCARLLREHPLEAGVDPGFEELGEAEAKRLAEEFWTSWLDDRHAAGDPILERLRDVALQPSDLKRAFLQIVDDSDVTFRAEAVPEPEFAAVRDGLLGLMRRTEELLRDTPPAAETDNLQGTVQRLRFLYRSTAWGTARDFFAALRTITKSGCAVTQKHWSDERGGKAAAKDLGKAFEALVVGPARELLGRWYAHRYGLALAFLEPLLREFADHRRRTGRLTFQDLLQGAADLLRRNPEVRRRLGERYRYLLVDEFQDTDPLQAEVCFLLSSEPDQGDDWRRVRPRPGALFMVGDPKQSIYRFRRADIEVYDLVRRRMQEFGIVLQLTTNFRSVHAVGRFVDAVFRELFAPDPLPGRQAGFAPMNTRRPDTEGSGVFRYVVPSCGKERQAVIEARDAALVATWIAAQVGDGRSPGDFLVLPYRKRGVEVYARELERRGLPVTTSGGGLALERELRELLIVLEALADPQDSIRTVAALEGLFFGLDPETLWRHRVAGGRFSFERPELDRSSAIERSLQMLGRWAGLFRRLPVDAALQAMVDELGLLPLAAAGELGESRAGSLVHGLDVVAESAVRGAADLPSAIEAIRAAVASPEVEAPLRPGRTDAVRVMNLHKAKGLEAPVVVLPSPFGRPDYSEGDRRPTKHVRRTDDGAVHGYVQLKGSAEAVLAQPLDWDDLEAREAAFLEAELDRLLYVACTRAIDALVVGECEATHDRSPWRELRAELLAQARPLDLTTSEPGVRRRPTATVKDVESEIAAVRRRHERAATAAFSAGTVTREAEEELEFRGSVGRGTAWGTLVHDAVAAMGRGRDGAELRGYCRALLRASGRRVDPRGEPEELEELMSVTERVRRSGAWRALSEATESRWELALARVEPTPEGPPRLVTGTIDALAIGAAGQPWRIVDWKTDAVEGAEWEARESHYRRQVDAYREMIAELAGVDVRGSIERVKS